MTDTGMIRSERSRDAPLARALLIVGGVGAAIAIPAVLACVVVVLGPAWEHAGAHRRTRMRDDAQAVRSAVLLYMGQTPGAPCPDLATLDSSGVLDRSRRTTDAWDHPFHIACTGDDIIVRSDGRDGIAGTVDDID